MNVQFLSNEKGKKTAVVIPIKDWEEIQEKLMISNADFMDEVPEYVKDGIATAQRKAAEGEGLQHGDVMKKYSKYL